MSINFVKTVQIWLHFSNFFHLFSAVFVMQYLSKILYKLFVFMSGEIKTVFNFVVATLLCNYLSIHGFFLSFFFSFWLFFYFICVIQLSAYPH